MISHLIHNRPTYLLNITDNNKLQRQRDNNLKKSLPCSMVKQSPLHLLNSGMDLVHPSMLNQDIQLYLDASEDHGIQPLSLQLSDPLLHGKLSF